MRLPAGFCRFGTIAEPPLHAPPPQEPLPAEALTLFFTTILFISITPYKLALRVGLLGYS
jgi:hypothetical protein